MTMNSPHTVIMTTSPIAIRSGQKNFHVFPNTFLMSSVRVGCPDCGVLYDLFGGYPKSLLLVTLDLHHKTNTPHPPYIPNEPSIMTLRECDCAFSAKSFEGDNDGRTA